MKALYSVKEAAELVGRSPRTVLDWIANGELEGAQQINGRWYLPARIVHEWLGITTEAVARQVLGTPNNEGAP